MKNRDFGCRFLCGDYALFGEFEKAIEKHLVKKRTGFIGQKLAENHARTTNSAARFICSNRTSRKEKAAYGIFIRRVGWRGWRSTPKTSTRWRSTGRQRRDMAKLKESQDFLLRVRNELHFSTGKHQDQLTFEQQEKVSAALGFKARGRCAVSKCLCARTTSMPREISRIAINRAPIDPERAPAFRRHDMLSAETCAKACALQGSHITLTKPEFLQRIRAT